MSEDVESLSQEINFSKIVLRDICSRFGDVEWLDDITIPEILNVHLLPYLEGHLVRVKGASPYTKSANLLFEVWKKCLKKPRSNSSPRYITMICNRLKEGYTEAQIVQGIVGLSKSDHHIANGYTHITYVARSAGQLDLMINKAISHGITEERCNERWGAFLKNSGEFETNQASEYINPITGRKLK